MLHSHYLVECVAFEYIEILARYGVTHIEHLLTVLLLQLLMHMARKQGRNLLNTTYCHSHTLRGDTHRPPADGAAAARACASYCAAVWAHVRMRIFVYVCVHVSMYVCVYMRVCMWVCMYVCMLVCIRARIYV